MLMKRGKGVFQRLPRGSLKRKGVIHEWGSLRRKVNPYSGPTCAQMQKLKGFETGERKDFRSMHRTHLGHRGIYSWCPRCGTCHGRRGWAHRSPRAARRLGPWSPRCSCSRSAARRRSRSRCSGRAPRRMGPPSPRRQSPGSLREDAEVGRGKKIKLHYT